MSRCKACNVILTESELTKIDRYTGMHLDLCGECHKISDDALEGNWAEDSGESVIISEGRVVIN